MEIFQIVSNLLKEHGILYTLVTLLVGFLMMMAISARDKITAWIGSLFKRRRSQKITQDDLLGHELFSSLNKYVYIDVPHFDIGERLRNAIFKDYLLFVFVSTKKELENFISKGDLEQIPQHLFKSRVLDCVTNITRNYNQKAVEEGIPPVAIRKFEEWQQNRNDAIYGFVSDVCSEDMFSTNIWKTKIILDFLVHINNMTIIDAKKSLTTLNGELSKASYKGATYELLH